MNVMKDSTVPVIVRIAGLPAEVMEPFGSQECLDRACAIQRLESELSAVRSLAVDRLHEKIEGAPPEVRHVLIAIKRDCFNGRALSARRTSSDWAVFEAAAPDVAARIGELEEELAAQRDGFERTFRAEQEREVRHVLSLVGNENLQQGLALASPELSSADRLRKPFDSYKRKERRLMQSLVRYISRTALKLSPFSTLTRLGLGTVVDDGPSSGVGLLLGGSTQRELRRIRKHVVVKYDALLRQLPAYRDQLHVQLNPSIQGAGPGRYRFIVPFYWKLSQETREFLYHLEAQASANLRGPLVEELLSVLDKSRPYDELIQLLSHKLASEAAVVESVVRKLIDMGFLLLLFPWPTNHFDPERQLLSFLERLPLDGALAEFAHNFERMLDLRDAAPPAGARLRGYREIDELRLKGFRILTEAMDLPEAKEDTQDKHVYEDVFLLPGEPGQDAVTRIPRQSAEEALASVRPLVLYSDLNYTRYEFLHSLAALAEKHWPGRQEVDFLDLFHVAQPLWGEYVKAATATIREWKPELWNPYGLEEIAELNRLRKTVLREMSECMREEGGELVIDRDGAERAVSRIPDTYVPAFGPCLFAQPATPDGGLWILNHLLDGTGRFSNRYTTVMPAGLRDRYSSHLGEGGAGVTLLGQSAEMIEILCARDDHLNVHKVQTARVIEMPGENPDLPPERRLGLGDLRVRLDGPLPVLVDRSGQLLMPIFLGTNGLVGMPTLVRFLSRFGIGEFRVMHPARPTRQQGGVTVSPRLRIGNLVVRRRLWSFSPAAAFAGFADATDADLFLAVHRWRLEHGIPDRVFVAERMQAKFSLWPLHKPQYIDFTSPSFIPVLRSAMETTRDELKMEEMLPVPEAFPADEDGRKWAFEAQLESIAFHRNQPWKPQGSRVSRSQLQSGELAQQPSLMAQGG
jgi:hypothetical protein